MNPYTSTFILYHKHPLIQKVLLANKRKHLPALYFFPLSIPPISLPDILCSLWKASSGVFPFKSLYATPIPITSRFYANVTAFWVSHPAKNLLTKGLLRKSMHGSSIFVFVFWLVSFFLFFFDLIFVLRKNKKIFDSVSLWKYSNVFQYVLAILSLSRSISLSQKGLFI